jgi:hypothetical protein
MAIGSGAVLRIIFHIGGSEDSLGLLDVNTHSPGTETSPMAGCESSMTAVIDIKNLSRYGAFTNWHAASLRIDTSPSEVEIPFSETVFDESGSYTIHPGSR